jgi:hypothetical protein
LAYPFFRFPTFVDFKSKLETEFGCRFVIGDDLCDGDGDSQPITFFEREVDGETLRCVVSVTDDQLPVAPTFIRNICGRLRINPKDCGLDLG